MNLDHPCCDCGHPFEDTELTAEYLSEYGEHKCDGCIREYDKDFVAEMEETQDDCVIRLLREQANSPEIFASLMSQYVTKIKNECAGRGVAQLIKEESGLLATRIDHMRAAIVGE